MEVGQPKKMCQTPCALAIFANLGGLEHTLERWKEREGERRREKEREGESEREREERGEREREGEKVRD